MCAGDQQLRPMFERRGLVLSVQRKLPPIDGLQDNETCPPGQYSSSGACLPCHISCGTCANGTACLTCAAADTTLRASDGKLCVSACGTPEYSDGAQCRGILLWLTCYVVFCSGAYSLYRSVAVRSLALLNPPCLHYFSALVMSLSFSSGETMNIGRPVACAQALHSI